MNKYADRYTDIRNTRSDSLLQREEKHSMEHRELGYFFRLDGQRKCF